MGEEKLWSELGNIWTQWQAGDEWVCRQVDEGRRKEGIKDRKTLTLRKEP